jgi:hypothetical protein
MKKLRLEEIDERKKSGLESSAKSIAKGLREVFNQAAGKGIILDVSMAGGQRPIDVLM